MNSFCRIREGITTSNSLHLCGETKWCPTIPSASLLVLISVSLRRIARKSTIVLQPEEAGKPLPSPVPYMAVNLVRKIFQKHPLLANSVVYGTLYVGAEFSQQVFTKRILVKDGEEEDIDVKTLGRYLVIGSLINSNYLFAWYKWLDRRYPATTTKVIIKKVLLDQFLMTPPLYVIFYASMSLMEGKSDLFQECREKFVKTFTTSCLFWIPAQVVNFTYLPNSARVTYLGLCSFAWVNILCWIKRSKINDEETSRNV